ncbi:unnamed protein product [Acanthosepion pharaonis]|uniref:C2H2-type domain-containing protein n=1 Tax=Acanthosepion pharaonis TaxID=158019 RepID=A0A812AY42_ACAPH|nr:unnamed protein product [Sepia pharaonis]
MLALLKDSDIECLGEVPTPLLPPLPPLHHQPLPSAPPTATSSSGMMPPSGMTMSSAPALPQKPRPEKIYKCPSCDKSFSQLGNLKTHQNIHNPIKPYQDFAQCSHLNQHMRNKHEGKVPLDDSHGNRRNKFAGQCDTLGRPQPLPSISTIKTSNSPVPSNDGYQPNFFPSFNQLNHPQQMAAAAVALTNRPQQDPHMQPVPGASPYPIPSQQIRNPHPHDKPMEMSLFHHFAQSGYFGHHIRDPFAYPPPDGYIPNHFPLSYSLKQYFRDSPGIQGNPVMNTDSKDFLGKPLEKSQPMPLMLSSHAKMNQIPKVEGNQLTQFDHHQNNILNLHDRHQPNQMPSQESSHVNPLSPHNSPHMNQMSSPERSHLNPMSPSNRNQTTPMSSPNRSHSHNNQLTLPERPHSSQMNNLSPSDRPQSTHMNHLSSMDRSHSTHMNHLSSSERSNNTNMTHLSPPDRPNSSHMNHLSPSERPNSNHVNHLSPSDRSNSTQINHLSPLERPNSIHMNHLSPSDRSNSTQVNHLPPLDRPNSTHVNHLSPLDRPNSTHVNHLSPLDRPNSTHVNHLSPSDRPNSTHVNHLSPLDRPNSTHVNHLSPSDRPNSTHVNHLSPLDRPNSSQVNHLSPSDRPQNSNINHVSPSDRPQSNHMNHLPQSDRPSSTYMNHLSPPDKPQNNHMNHISSSDRSQNNHMSHLSPDKSQSNTMTPANRAHTSSHLTSQEIPLSNSHLPLPDGTPLSGQSTSPLTKNLTQESQIPETQLVPTSSNSVYDPNKDSQLHNSPDKNMNGQSTMSNTLSQQQIRVPTEKALLESTPVQLLKVPQYGPLQTNVPLLVPQYDTSLISIPQNHYSQSIFISSFFSFNFSSHSSFAISFSLLIISSSFFYSCFLSHIFFLPKIVSSLISLVLFRISFSLYLSFFFPLIFCNSPPFLSLSFLHFSFCSSLAILSLSLIISPSFILLSLFFIHFSLLKNYFFFSFPEFFFSISLSLFPP